MTLENITTVNNRHRLHVGFTTWGDLDDGKKSAHLGKQRSAQDSSAQGPQTQIFVSLFKITKVSHGDLRL